MTPTEIRRFLGICAFVAALMAGLMWAAPDADDAMAAVEADQAHLATRADTLARIDSLTSVRWEQDRRYTVERMLEDTTRALRDCRVERGRLEAGR